MSNKTELHVDGEAVIKEIIQEKIDYYTRRPPREHQPKGYKSKYSGEMR